MKAAMDATLRMPPCCRVISGRKASVRALRARILRSMTQSCSFALRSLTRPIRPKPALLTRYLVARPAALSFCARISLASGDDRSSTIIVGVLAPARVISSARASRRSFLRATITISWPFWAKTRASSAPMPSDAPVMTAAGRSEDDGCVT